MCAPCACHVRSCPCWVLPPPPVPPRARYATYQLDGTWATRRLTAEGWVHAAVEALVAMVWRLAVERVPFFAALASPPCSASGGARRAASWSGGVRYLGPQLTEGRVHHGGHGVAPGGGALPLPTARPEAGAGAAGLEVGGAKRHCHPPVRHHWLQHQHALQPARPPRCLSPIRPGCGCGKGGTRRQAGDGDAGEERGQGVWVSGGRGPAAMLHGPPSCWSGGGGGWRASRRLAARIEGRRGGGKAAVGPCCGHARGTRRGVGPAACSGCWR